jgi:hypothetical protein
MAKKKVDEPLFLEFVNFPIFGTKIVKNEKIDFSSGISFIHRNENDSEITEDGLKILNFHNEMLKQEIRTGVKNYLEYLLKKCESKFSEYQATYLKLMLFETDFDDWEPDEYRDDLVWSVNGLWARFRRLIRSLIESDVLQKSKPIDRLSVFHESDPLLPGVDQVICRNDIGGFEIELEPILDPGEGDFIKTPQVVRYISADFGNFLLKHYKPGILTYCKLEKCGKIIITTNGRKYCCDSHRVKASNETKKKDLDHAEYIRIRDRLSKRYYRYGGLKSPLNEFVLKNWPSDKLDLLHRFSRSAK